MMLPKPAGNFVELSVQIDIKGDNLGLIAKRNRTTVKEIMRWNRLKSTVIRPGQKLRINKPKPRA